MKLTLKDYKNLHAEAVGASPTGSDDAALEAHRQFMRSTSRPDSAYRAIKEVALANENARTYPVRSELMQRLISEKMAQNGGDYDLAFAAVRIENPKLLRS